MKKFKATLGVCKGSSQTDKELPLKKKKYKKRTFPPYI